MGKIGENITVIAIAIIGVAILAVLVSNSARTTDVIASIGGAFSNSLGAALSPVTSGGSLR